MRKTLVRLALKAAIIVALLKVLLCPFVGCAEETGKQVIEEKDGAGEAEKNAAEKSGEDKKDMNGSAVKKSEKTGGVATGDDEEGEVDSEDKSEGKIERTEWTRPKRSVASKVNAAAEDRLAQVEVGVIITAIGRVKLRRNTPDGEKKITELSQGDAVYAGDLFEVGKASAVEMRFGSNARLRIGENSVMRLANKVKVKDGDFENTRRDMDLKKGTARVRVKKNIRNPSQILLFSGNMVLTVDQSDAVVTRDRMESTVMVFNGEADVSVKESSDSVWGEERSVRVKRKYKIVIPGVIEGELPKKERMDEKEFNEARKKLWLTFSIEKAREELPPAPKRDREIEDP